MDGLCLRVAQPDEYRAWFVAERAALQRRSPFHEPEWLETMDRASRGRLAIIGVYRAGRLVGAVPGYLARRGPFRLFGSPLRKTLTTYLGPVVLPGVDVRQVLDSGEEFARREWGVDYTEVTLRDPPAAALDPGWRPIFRGTYCLDLTQGEARLWAGLKSRCRGAIRKSEKLGLQVVPLLDAALHAEILRQTFARRGMRAPYSERFLASVLHLAAAGLVSGWGAKYEDRIIANGLVLHDDREAHFLSGGTLSQYQGISGQTPLLWHAITSGAKSGRQVFDFAGRGVQGIDEFKEAFGPLAVDYWSASRAPRHIRLAERLAARSSVALAQLDQLLRPRFGRWLGAPGWG